MTANPKFPVVNPKFRAQIAENIKATIAKQKKEGVTGMSIANLLQVTPTTGLATCGDGPTGGANIHVVYKGIFHEVASLPQFSKFIIKGESV